MYDKVCKSCGYRLSEYFNSGYLGCPECYKQFREEIRPSLKRIQVEVDYRGKRPKLSFADREILNEYNALLVEKDKAFLEKRFDDIEKINRLLIDLSGELKRRGII